MERPNCECHDEAMYWQRDVRLTAGGWWECGVRRREVSRARYAANAEVRRAQVRAYYYRPDGGWLHKRRSQLRAQRARITEQLEQLAEEAATC